MTRKRFGRAGSYFYAAGLARVREDGQLQPRKKRKIKRTYVQVTPTKVSLIKKTEVEKDERVQRPHLFFLALFLIIMGFYFALNDNTILWMLCLTQGCAWFIFSTRKKPTTGKEKASG